MCWGILPKVSVMSLEGEAGQKGTNSRVLQYTLTKGVKKENTAVWLCGRKFSSQAKTLLLFWHLMGVSSQPIWSTPTNSTSSQPMQMLLPHAPKPQLTRPWKKKRMLARKIDPYLLINMEQFECMVIQYMEVRQIGGNISLEEVMDTWGNGWGKSRILF